MKNLQASVVGKMEVRRVGQGFTRDEDGRIFFVTSLWNCPIRWVVLEDGTIMRTTTDIPAPWEEVTLIRAEDLGVKSFGWAPTGTKLTL